MAPVFGYWPLRGLGQHIRLLLEYTGEKYQEKLYTSREEWFAEKFKLGLHMPNLPYYIDGDLKLTESNAIFYHIGRKHNLCGETEKDKAYVDMVVHQAFDLRIKFAILSYKDYNTEKEQYLQNLQDRLKVFSDYLGKKKWFIGDKITVADFWMYEVLDIHLILDGTCLNNFSNLKEFKRHFEELPAIKKYMASSRFISKPISGPEAIFNN